MKKHKRRVISVLIPLASIAILSWFVSTLNQKYPHLSHAASVVSPPSSIASNCSSDVTSALNAWFASLPASTTVNLPANSCYQVSNSPSNFLTIQSTNHLTINGNGTTFEQTVFDSGNAQQPVLALYLNANLTINNVNIAGPNSNSGSGVEGDMGILLEQDNGVMLNGITINNVDGDGMDLLAYKGNLPGVNWNVTMTNSHIENVGYHALVPEYSDGFTFENSTLTTGNIDAEVDFSCQPPQLQLSDCGTMSNPNVGVVNMTYKNDSFPNGMELLDGMSCMPVGNWAIENNNFGTGGLNLQFNTTYSLSLSALQNCGQQSGLTVTGNTSTNTSLRPCCGAGSPYILVQGWKNVNISNNNFVYDLHQGLVGDPVFDLWGDSNVSIASNRFLNLFTLIEQNAPSTWPANSNISKCGNTYGESGNTETDAACPIVPKTSGSSGSGSSPTNTVNSSGSTSTNSTGTSNGTTKSTRQYGHSSKSGTASSPGTSASGSSTAGSNTSSPSIINTIRDYNSTLTGKIVIYTIVVVAAVTAAIFSVLLWSERWQLASSWRRMLMHLGLIGHKHNLMASSSNQPDATVVNVGVLDNSKAKADTNNEDLIAHITHGHQSQVYKPGETIRPDK